MCRLTCSSRITLHPFEPFSGTVPASVLPKETIVLFDKDQRYTDFGLRGEILIMTLELDKGVVVFNWVTQRKVLHVSPYTEQLRMLRR